MCVLKEQYNNGQVMMSSLDYSMCQKGEKRKNYTTEFKHEAIKYDEKNSNHKTAKKFCVTVKRIREWRQSKLKIFEATIKPRNKRLKARRRRPLDQ